MSGGNSAGDASIPTTRKRTVGPSAEVVIERVRGRRVTAIRLPKSESNRDLHRAVVPARRTAT